MPAPRPLLRIAVNVALDGVLAAISVPVARWIAEPGGNLLQPTWLLPIGAVSLLVAGLPFRLSLQYWRFAGISDLISVAAASVGAAALFALVLHLAGFSIASPAFPIIHAFTLLVLLGAPRVGYRRAQIVGGGALADNSRDNAGAGSALLIGAGEDADLFLRALSQERRSGLRVAGLLSLGTRQTGRRIQGFPILGPVDDLVAVLDRLRAEDRLPSVLVIATPDVTGDVLARGDRRGARLWPVCPPRAASDGIASGNAGGRGEPAGTQAGGDRGPAQPRPGAARP